MVKLTSEEIQQAKDVDLVSLCQENGIELFQRPGEYHQLRWTEHDSLVISLKKNIFKWWSKDNVGGDAINFARYVLGKDTFYDSVKFLVEKDYQKAEIIQEEPEEFEYTFKNEANFNQAKGYLIERGIDSEIIDCLHTKGFLQEVKRFDYKTQSYQSHIAFVWSKSGIVSGTTTQNLRYDMDSDGNITKEKPNIMKNSEKNFGFNISVGKPEKVYVFEGAVDLLSYWSLNKDIKDSMLVSMEGVKEETLNNFLNYAYYSKGFIPKEVIICTDNDVAGHGLNDKFRGKQYVSEDGELLTFITHIPQDNYVPEKMVELYHDVLTETNSSLPMTWLAAVHKSLTNFSEDGSAVIGKQNYKYLVYDKYKETEPYDLKRRLQQFVSDFDKSTAKELDKLTDLLKQGTWGTETDDSLVKKVKEYIDVYTNEDMIITESVVKDWNDVLMLNEKTLPHQLKAIHYGNDKQEQVNIEYVPSNKEDDQDNKPYKGIKKGVNSRPVLFFEAESLKEAQTLAKAYGFYALDKEDSRKFNITNNKKQQSASQSTKQSTPRQMSY